MIFLIKKRKLVLDLFKHHRGAGCHDRDARDMFLMLGLGHCEAFDIVAAAGKKSGDTRKHTRLIVNENRKRPSLRKRINRGIGIVTFHLIKLSMRYFFNLSEGTD
mgnify:CR=1 FL=1